MAVAGAALIRAVIRLLVLIHQSGESCSGAPDTLLGAMVSCVSILKDVPCEQCIEADSGGADHTVEEPAARIWTAPKQRLALRCVAMHTTYVRFVSFQVAARKRGAHQRSA